MDKTSFFIHSVNSYLSVCSRKSVCKKNKVNYGILRYFNIVGSSPSGQIGLINEGDHLFKNFAVQTYKKKPIFRIYGANYKTKDKTCVRDFIHVSDIAEAHLLGIDFMKKTSGFTEFNLGNGNGFSVLDVIKSSEDISGKSVKYDIYPRRDGDPDILVADSSKAKKLLNWKPKFNKMNSIIESAWKWHNGEYLKKIN